MRVFNHADLLGDINFHLTTFWQAGAAPSPQEAVFVRWLEKAWLKHFFSVQEGFLWDVRVRRIPSMFKSDSASSAPVRLSVKTPKTSLDLDPETEWDIKDADNGTLMYYHPSGGFTLSKFASDVSYVRDYAFSLIEADPKVDLLKRTYETMWKAAETWHEEQQRILRARMEAEAALRAAGDASRAVPAWDHLVRGTDWDLATPEPFELNGMKFIAVRLKSVRALEYESYVLGHCVHSYGRQIVATDPVCTILSVRALESAHLPLVTAELSSSTKNAYTPYYIQIRGKHNHDAEQTVKGISTAMSGLLKVYDRSVFEPLSGDLSFIIQRGIA